MTIPTKVPEDGSISPSVPLYMETVTVSVAVTRAVAVRPEDKAAGGETKADMEVVAPVTVIVEVRTEPAGTEAKSIVAEAFRYPRAALTVKEPLAGSTSPPEVLQS